MNHNQEKPKKTKEQKPVKAKGIRKLRVPLYKQFEGKKLETHLTCEICGREYKNLTNHLYLLHGVRPEEYKIDYPETKYLLSEEMRVQISLQTNDYSKKEKRLLTPKEIAFVKKNYLTMPFEEIAKELHLSTTTVFTIVQKNIQEKKLVQNKWTKEDIAYLKKHYKHMTFGEIASQLQRSDCSVFIKASRIGLKKDGNKEKAVFYPQGAPKEGINIGKAWMKKEDEYIKNNYKTKMLEQIASFLGRTPLTVKDRKIKLKLGGDGLLYSNKGKDYFWSDEDVQTLKTYYKKIDIKELCVMLGRKKPAILRKARKLGIIKNDVAIFYPEGVPKPGINTAKQWLPEEDEYIKQFYKIKTIEELASFLGRSKYSVHGRMSKLNLLESDKRHLRSEKGKNRFWSDEQLQILINCYMIMDTKELSTILNRNNQSIDDKARKLGLKKVHNW